MVKKQPETKKNAIEQAIDLAELNTIEKVATRNRIEEAVQQMIQHRLARIPWDHYIDTVLAPHIERKCRELCDASFSGGTAIINVSKLIGEIATQKAKELIEVRLSLKDPPQ